VSGTTVLMSRTIGSARDTWCSLTGATPEAVRREVFDWLVRMVTSIKRLDSKRLARSRLRLRCESVRWQDVAMAGCTKANHVPALTTVRDTGPTILGTPVSPVGEVAHLDCATLTSEEDKRMRIKPTTPHTRLHYVLAVSCLLGLLASSASLGQTADSVVPVTSEPQHKIRFDNGKVRMYELNLPKGKATLMHEHRADSFSIFFSSSEVTLEPRGGTPTTINVPVGFVGFTSTAQGPYSHRVVASTNTDLHVISMELISRKPDRAASPNHRADPPFHVVLENPRGRAYRIRLAPGESTGPYTRPGSTALFAISAGRIAEDVDGQSKRLWDFETGDFKWIDVAQKLSLKNEGTAPVDLVEIEVF
jgi:mannose-6-phosphate isomerase-like protein (cupin superfamily)